MKFILFCVYIYLHIGISTTLSYEDWHNKVWSKWKKVGYISDKSHNCERKQAFGRKGIIESPNYPLQYPSNANCEWVIETPEEYTEIRLRFIHFNVETVKWSKLCFKDSLEIFQYSDGTREKKGRFCGRDTGKVVKIYGNKVEFRFKTNGYRNKRGFKIEWEAIKGCGGIIKNKSEGIINLPHSKNTEKFFFCQWTIHAPAQHNSILIDIQQLQLTSPKQQENCRKTSIQIINEHNQIISEYCSTLSNSKSVRIHGRFVIVKVKVNKKTKRTHFKAKWKTFAKQETLANFQCGRPFVGNGLFEILGVQEKNVVHSRKRRLVGGKPVARGEWPWIVQIRVTLLSRYYTTQTVTCGGVIVSPSHIITAAHCLVKTTHEVIHYEILLGAITEDNPSQQVIQVERNDIIVHPQFSINSRTRKPQNDIAVITLREKLRFGYNVQPVCLPTSKDEDKNCHFAGWGKTSENSLHSSHVNSIEARLWGHCDRSPSVLCATYDGKNTGACKGDSGSPLICTRTDGSKYLVGILSYGGRTCPSIVDGHMDIKYYLDWISNIIKNPINT